MARVFVAIGSNHERERNIDFALDALTGTFGSLDVSPTYRSAAHGASAPDYYNLVVGFDSDLPPARIIGLLKRIERDAGRTRDTAACALDLDLLAHGDTVERTDAYVLPHDDIARHAFVLQPLSDLAPDVVHPVLNRSYRELRDAAVPPEPALVEVRRRGSR